MDGILIVVGVMWLLYYIIKELSWRTNAYNNKKYDVSKAFDDACVKRISNSEFKRNYKSGKYSK